LIGYNLVVNVENLNLVGSVNGTGNSTNNIINGGVGNNVINGAAGNDTLTGGTGSDTFTFGGSPLLNLLTAIGVDSITDFSKIEADKVQLSKTYFTALATTAGNPLLATDFSSVTTDLAAATAVGTIVYNNTNGKLFYNADGATNNAATAGFGTNGGQFVQLTAGLALTAADFNVVA
jgi:Ca2+-binding RTX toxin-like protein